MILADRPAFLRLNKGILTLILVGAAIIGFCSPPSPQAGYGIFTHSLFEIGLIALVGSIASVAGLVLTCAMLSGIFSFSISAGIMILGFIFLPIGQHIFMFTLYFIC